MRFLQGIVGPGAVALSLSLMLCSSTTNAWSVGAEYEVIVSEGDAPPRGNGTIAGFSTLRLSDADDVFFFCPLTGTSGGSSDNAGLYLYVDGAGVMTVAREGDPAPDGDGVYSFETNGFTILDINNLGTLAFTIGFKENSSGRTDENGVLADYGSGVVLLAREGDVIPSGNTFQFFYNLALGEGDHVSFFAGIDTDGIYTDLPEQFGWFRIDPDGTVRTLARNGTAAPGGGFINPGNTFPFTSETGHVAFSTLVTGGPNDFGTFRSDGTTLVAIARTGDSFGGDTLHVPSARGIAPDGRVVLNAGLNGNTSPRVILLGDGTTFTEVIRTGDLLPDGSIASVDDFDRVFVNSADEMLLDVTDQSFTRHFVFRDALGNDTHVASVGDVAPNGDGEFQSFTLVEFSELGGVLLDANLINTSSGPFSVEATYYWNGSTLIELFREGDVVDLNGMQEIAYINAHLSGGATDRIAAEIGTVSGLEIMVLATPFVNESFGTAYQLVSGSTITGNLSEAGNDGSSSCDPGTPDLFYSIEVITGPATIEANTCGSSADTALALYNSVQAELDCNTDCGGSPCGGMDACVSATGLSPGTYYLRVSAQGRGQVAGTSGAFQLTATVSGGEGACCLTDLSCMDLLEEDCINAGGLFQGGQTQCSNIECFNDDCEDALPISTGLTSFSTVGATTDGDNDRACEQADDSNGQTYADIWYVYTADCTGTLTVTTCEELGGSADYDSDIKVYSGISCTDQEATIIGCNDDDDDNPCGISNFHSTVRVAVVEGMKYLIRIGGWGSTSDVGTGELLIVCDPMIRACCLPDETCATLMPADCVMAGGVFQIDAQDCASSACANALCVEDVCQTDNGGFASTSDVSTDFVVADNFTLGVTSVVESLCWWGVYADATPTFNSCNDGPGDIFSISYYTGNPPITLVYGPFVANVVGKSTDGTFGSFTKYRYQALHPPIELEAGTEYWIEITNDTPGDCDWYWVQSTQGDGTIFQDQDGDGYEAAESIEGDMAFCLGFGEFTGACCMSDGSCAMLSEDDCDAADGTYQGMLTHCLTEACPQPSSCIADFVDNVTFLPPPDGQVDGADLGYLLSQWGRNPGSIADIVDNVTFQPPADGVVDGADLGYLLSTWGPCK